MNKFETIILFNPDVNNKIIDKEIKSFEKIIEENDGKIINTEDWGLRNLSYDIKTYKKAFYKFFQIEIGGEKINNIKKNLNQNEIIMRNLFVKVSNHDELPTKLADEEK